MKPNENPKYEMGIVWLDETAKQRPFLREVTDRFATGRARPMTGKKFGIVIVAYSVLAPDARGNGMMKGRFVRRYWYNRATDPREGMGYCTDGWCNDACVEGVLPESIAPNVASVPAWNVLKVAPRRWP